MQSIVPVPVPQNMQSQVRNRTPLGMKSVVKNFYHDCQADLPSPLQEMSVDNGINTSTSIHPPQLRDSRTYVNSERYANQNLAPANTDLRAQLAAVISTGHQHQRQHPHSHASHGYVEGQNSNCASPHDHNIDPAIGCASGAGNSMMMNTGGDSGGDDINDGRKCAKRELSQSKRAAQNRAAQRAFRQRKEGYIKKLEEQVRELHNMNDSLKASQAENYSLREYIIHLQSRLIESQGDFPQPPPNVNLAHPHSRIQHHAPIAPMNSLQASTARSLAAAGLGTKQEPYETKQYKDTDNPGNDDDKLRTQLQTTSDGMPGPI